MVFLAYQKFIVLALANIRVDALQVKVASDEPPHVSSPPPLAPPGAAVVESFEEIISRLGDAATAGNAEVVKEIFDEAGSRSNVGKKLLEHRFGHWQNGQEKPVSLVWLAGRFGHFEVVRFLVGVGANVQDARTGLGKGISDVAVDRNKSGFYSKMIMMTTDFRVVDLLFPFMQKHFDGLPDEVRGLIGHDADALVEVLGEKRVPDNCIEKVLEFCPRVFEWRHVFNSLDALVLLMRGHKEWVHWVTIKVDVSSFWRYKVLECNLRQLLQKADPATRPQKVIFTRIDAAFHAAESGSSPSAFAVEASRDDGCKDECDPELMVLLKTEIARPTVATLQSMTFRLDTTSGAYDCVTEFNFDSFCSVQ